jgi:hypothetical protein
MLPVLCSHETQSFNTRGKISINYVWGWYGKRVFGPKKKEVMGCQGKLNDEDLHIVLYSCVAHMKEMRTWYRIVMANNLKPRDYLGNLNIDERIILRHICWDPSDARQWRIKSVSTTVVMSHNNEAAPGSGFIWVPHSCYWYCNKVTA